MSSEYNADAIEILTGLDPVRTRPGMYTDTSRPNHLIQEVELVWKNLINFEH